MPLAGLVRGAESVVAPRVLVDTTAVPADRGALGRYVDGLICALGVAGADLAVACQRADEERYGRLVPSARIVAAPPAIAHRPARLAWEQSGLPVVAQQVGAGVMHAVFHQPAEDKLRQISDRLGLHGKPYVAYLGALEPRKNVPALINGWVEVVADLSEPPALVLAGGSGWSEEVDAA